MDRASREKISKNTEDLNHLDLTNIYRTLHKTKAEYTYFSSTSRIFSRKDKMQDYKQRLNKITRTDI